MHIVFNNTNIDSSLYKVRVYKKGDVLFYDGDNCTEVGLLETGSISIVTNTYGDNEYEINHISDDGFFGTYLLFGNNHKYLGTAVAKKQSKVICFDKQSLMKAMEDKTFLANYLSLTSNSYLKLQQKVKVLSQRSIKEKILFILYQNYQFNNTRTYVIKSKEILANYLNVTRPALSRALIELQNENIISFDRYSITIKKSSQMR